MNRYSADSVMRELTDFQRRSVDHVVAQLYDEHSDRFLVADETGLGKSMVARGVIARAIERLQDDDSVQRVDIVYVCANSDLAQQNIGRLNVTEDEQIAFSSRLTLLGKHSSQLRERAATRGKPVNLVSFTPGTSFDMGHSTGQAQERAMLYLALEHCVDLDGWQRRAARRLFQGGVRTRERFEAVIYDLEWQLGDEGIDPGILRQFNREIGRGGKQSLLTRFEQAVDEIGHRRDLPPAVEEAKWDLVRELRSALAFASVETLEPDLVILDEFQRFRHLLDNEHPAGELADQLFRFPGVKVLLLSATPFKPFTYAEEHDEDHATDFYRTLHFLAEGTDAFDPDDVRKHLEEYRRMVVTGGDPTSAAASARSELLRVMSRQERPVLVGHAMSTEHVQPATRVTATDLVGYAALHQVAQHVRHDHDRSLVTAEYWKSAPYFLNFSDGYQLGARLRAATLDAPTAVSLGRTQHLVSTQIERFQAIDHGNARMRDLVDATVGRDWWKLLWIPPSLPYLQPGGPYAEATDVTKMLVFSSWTATPAAVASLLSYEAERRAAQGTNYEAYTSAARRKLTQPLNYSLDGDRPARMSTLTLFWPMPGLAEAVDPLKLASEAGGLALTAAEAERQATTRLRALVPFDDVASSSDGQADNAADSDWQFVFSMASAWPPLHPALDPGQLEMIVLALAGDQPSTEDDESGQNQADFAGITAHVKAAAGARASEAPAGSAQTVSTLSVLALHSPANCAYRALGRLLTDEDSVDDFTRFIAATALANGLRSLFNRPDATKIVEGATDPQLPYWARVLQYCSLGNLQAVLDEYLHHLRQDKVKGTLDNEKMLALAKNAAAALSLRTTNYQALNVEDLEKNLRFVPRFALRYGGRRLNAEDARQPEVRNAFNSPFWPFVLVSTSVGQEGIDFHWWCHSVFHWNTPANPVDFEQREGRVDRYRGHAVRRNVASAHGPEVLANPGSDPWETAFRLAVEFCDQYGDFTPSWVYPGPATVERHVAPFALSSDLRKYERIKQDVALYRLAFGQPRQEDMIELLRSRGLDADVERLMESRIDLAP